MRDDWNVLTALEVTDLPPSKVDLRQAVRAGRRRERVRTLAFSGVTMLVVLATIVVTVRVAGGSHATPASGLPPLPSGRSDPGGQAAPSASNVAGPVVPPKLGPTSPPLGTCTFTDLRFDVHDPAGRNPTVAATSRDGRVVVAVFNSTTFRLLIDGVEQPITGLPTGASEVYHVNAAGDFVGGVGAASPFVYRNQNHKASPLPMPAGATDVSVVGLNDRGDVLVQFTLNGATRAAVWPAAQPAGLKLLTVPPLWTPSVMAIGADGTVAGVLVQSGSNQPVVWKSDGTVRKLPVLATDRSPMVTAINGDWVLARATRWNLKTGSVEPIVGIWGESLDKYGRVYGEQPDIAPPHPAVWVNGTVTRLPVDPVRPLGMMGDVNDDGTRITSILQADNPPDPRPVVWTCH